MNDQEETAEKETESDPEEEKEEKTGKDLEDVTEVEAESDSEEKQEAEADSNSEEGLEAEAGNNPEEGSEAKAGNNPEEGSGSKAGNNPEEGSEAGTGENPEKAPATATLTFEGSDYTVLVTYTENAGIPEGASLVVSEIREGSDEYNIYRAQAEDTIAAGGLSWIRLFDISIEVGGKPFEPAAPVSVQINYHEAIEQEQNTEVNTVHFEGKKETPKLLNTEAEGTENTTEQVSFETDSFSVFAIVGTVIEKTVLASDGQNYHITATYGSETGIPEDADLAVEEILPVDSDDASTSSVYNEYVSKTKNVLGWEEGSASYIRLFDIKIVDKDDSSVKYQPTEGTAVDIDIELADSESEELCVVHFANEDDTGSVMDAAADGKAVSFAADGFSVYAIVDGDDTTPETKSIQYVFHYSDKTPFRFINKNGDYTDTQYVKNGETLFYPGLPTDDPNQEGKEFWGWYEGTLNGDALEWGEEAEFETPISVNETATVNLYARYEQTYYVTYYDENGNIYSVVKHANGDSIRLDVAGTEISYTASNAQKAFLGWSTTFGTTDEVPENTTMTVTGNVSLYPAVNDVKWINFNGGETGNGASYTAPIYVLGNVVTSDKKPEDPTRRGYVFQGWYKDAACTQPFIWDGTETISEDITLYAKWVEADTKYTVIFWKQNVEGTGYDYVESSDRDALTGSTVSLRTTGTDGDTNRAGRIVDGKSYVGFHYNDSSSNSSATVLANGTTVLNVYYDRNVHTFYFYTGNGNSTYIYLRTNSNSGTQYGYWDGSYYRIYYTNGSWRRSNNNNGVIYSGTRYTRSSVNGLIHSVDALYGSDISTIWNFTGTNGVTYPRNNPPTSWTPHGSSTYSARITRMEIMPDEDIYFSYTTSSNTTRYFHYYVEALPGAVNTRTFNGRKYSLYTDLTHDFNRIYYEDDFWFLVGFTRQAIATANGTNVTNQIGSNTAWQSSWNSNLYFYYTRNSYDLEFRNSTVTSEVYATNSVKYQAPVADSIIADPNPPEGYTFHGWYADPSCSTRVFFTEPTEADLAELKYELNSAGRKTYNANGEHSDEYIVLEKMPASNYVLYANWAPKRYQVNIDPNGGALLTDGTQATYYNIDYGEKIGEYANVTRNYIKISQGQDVTGKKRYSYHYDTRTNNDGQHRWACYYEDPNGEYIEDETAYTFVGWYRVADNGAGIMDRAPFNFDTLIEENTTLRAMWRREGVFKVKYTNIMNEGKTGQLTSPDPKPNDDQYTYVDLAEAKVGPAIRPPENYQFAGWRVLGTESPVYNPGDIFVIDSNFAEYEQGGTMYVTLEPVFIQISDAIITYDINVPVGSTATSIELTDVENNMQTKLKDNGSIDLSSGNGFDVTGYRLIGWSDQKLNPNEYPIALNNDGAFSGSVPANTHLFKLGGTYGVSDSNTLYAVWELRTIPVPFIKQGEKTDGTYEQLAGAEFILYADEECSTLISSVYGTIDNIDASVTSSNETGTNVTFPKVPVGTFYFKETQVSSQYKLDNTTVHTIVVSESTDGNHTLSYTVDGVYSSTNPLVIKNHLKGTLAVTKTVDSIVEADQQKNFNFTATVLNTSNETDTSINGTYGDLNFTNGEASFDLKHGLEKKIRNLVGKTIIIRENDAVVYTTTAVSSTGSYNADSKSYTIRIPDDGDTVVFTNKLEGVPVKAVKTDQFGNALAGAVFSGDFVTDTIMTELTGPDDEKEAVIFNQEAVAVGEYTLHEDSAPAGYNQLPGDVTIEVTQNSTTGQILVSVKVGGEDSAFADAELVDSSDLSKGWIVTIRNDAGFELPSTGGPGTMLFKIFGLILITGAGLLLRRRQKLL